MMGQQTIPLSQSFTLPRPADHSFIEHLYPKDPAKRTNLLVNYLPASMGEEEFHAFFRVVGPIDSVRYDHRGYGFVKFTTHEDAAKAIVRFHQCVIKGKKLSVKWARCGGSRAKSNLFVACLPPDWDTEDLQKAFAEFGEIIECRVLKSDEGAPLRRGFVRFNTIEEAKEALYFRHQWRVPGTYYKLHVQVSAKQKRRTHKHGHRVRIYGEDGICRTVVGMHRGQHLMSTFDAYQPQIHQSNDAQSFCSDYKYNNYTPFAQCEAPYYQNTYVDSPMNGAWSHSDFKRTTVNSDTYVDYESNTPPWAANEFKKGQSSDDEATSKYSEKIWYEPRYDLNDSGESGSNSGSAGNTNAKIFASNLPIFFSEGAVFNLMSQYGKLENVELQHDVKGKSMGCCIIEFESEKEANEARSSLNNTLLCNRKLCLQLIETAT